MKKLLVFSFMAFFFMNIVSINAHCPLCTAATGAAVAATRWYGLDDSIVGVFVGSMIVATALWLNNLLKKRNGNREFLQFQPLILLFISFILTVVTLYYAKLVGPANQFKIFGIDRILFGVMIGVVASFMSFKVHDFIRAMNKNKNYFPYQGILILLLTLVATSSILFLVM